MSQALDPAAVLALYPPHRYTLSSLLDGRAQVSPDRPFVAFRGRDHSYRELQASVHRAAAMFAARVAKNESN
jgi:acyl-CoA synthetase (AMP-forming)/AMP-acid ligase II